MNEFIKFKQVLYENVPSKFQDIKFFLSHKKRFLKVRGIFLTSLTTTSLKGSLLTLPTNKANSRKFLSLFLAETPASHRH